MTIKKAADILEILWRFSKLQKGGANCLMTLVPQMPEKVNFLLSFSFPIVAKLTKKSPQEMFIGGRKGYSKELLFSWLLIKKVTNWDYRTIASMAGVSHPTLIRANELFLKKKIYQKVFSELIKKAKQKGLIKGKFIAIDASFVQTFSKRQELGSETWNEWKKAYGFKLHLLIDAETRFPIAVTITNGLAADITLAIPLLKKARIILKECDYVVADKGYDDGDLVDWIVKMLKAKAGIPIRKINRGKNYSWVGAWRNFQRKAKGRSIKKSIYKRRTAIERVLSMLKRTYHLGKEESRGILNFAKNVYLSLICYMLKLFYITGLI